MILILSTGFSISTLPFQIVSAPQGHSVSTFFKTSEISMQKLLQVYSSLFAPSAFTMKTTTSVTALTDNKNLRSR
ncbi:MAG TPA: hypothetical protein DC054_22435 [Blastocatellia bacterium]|nr:hypothetical protein [Blastocatellia bacterium]